MFYSKSKLSILNKFWGIMFALMLTGCATTWSTSDVKHHDIEDDSNTTISEQTEAAEIIISKDDITDREYEVIGDITVTVNKTTIFNKTPTPEMVNQKLREEAAKLGADAVILVQYGKAGISLLSWGTLEGKGRAIKFKS